MTIIVLDPGHGGQDPGAVRHGLQEKELALDIARKTRDALLPYAVDVYMTRNSDIDLGLAERAELANRLGANYFLSLHVNAGGGTGFESYIHPGAGARTLELRDVVHRHVSGFYESVGFRDRGKKNANYAVLRLTQMPAILLENLFIDTTGDVEKLADPVFRRQIAGAIATALVQALGLKPKDSIASAVQVLYNAGVIASPDYWVRNAQHGKIVDGEYAGMLIQNMAKFIEGARS